MSSREPMSRPRGSARWGVELCWQTTPDLHDFGAVQGEDQVGGLPPGKTGVQTVHARRTAAASAMTFTVVRLLAPAGVDVERQQEPQLGSCFRRVCAKPRSGSRR